MYAIIQVGSTQFKVSEGDVIDAHRLNEKEGKIVGSVLESKKTKEGRRKTVSNCSSYS